MVRFNRFIGSTLFLAAVSCTTQASADPHSTPVQILGVRVYSTGNSSTDVALIHVSAAAVCNTLAFSFPIGLAAGQGMLAQAITALSAGQNVTVEVSNATGCTVEANWGPTVQSLTLLGPGNAGPW